MKTKMVMISFSLVGLGAALALFLALSASPLKAQGLIVPGIEPEPFVPAYSAAGFAQSQSLQINVSNISNAQPPAPCDVLLQFRDGNLIAEKRVSLQPGQSDFFILSGTGIDDGTRKFARPVVSASTPTPIESCATLVTHVEIFNTFTGQTVAGVDPQPFLTR